MKINWKHFFLIVLSFAVFGEVKAEKWKVTTLEWPPFTCEKCPDQGVGCKALRDALKSVGVDVEFVFLPWNRAVKEGGKAEFIGYYPAWPEDVVDGFLGSDPIFKSPLGFVEAKSKPLGRLQALKDLAGKNIGSVQGYGNTKEFNELVKKGLIKSDQATADDFNIKKVAAGRLDGAIVDTNVAKYMLQTDLKDVAGKIGINALVAENKDLLLVFNKVGDSKARNAKLVEALKKVNTQKIVDDGLKDLLK